MSSCGSSDEDYASRRLHEIHQDTNQGTFVDWATDEEIVARRVGMEQNVREEVRRSAPDQPEGAVAGASRP